MLDSLSQPYIQRALLEIALLAVAGGVLGTWIVLRGLAFFSHAVGTAAFPGLVLAAGLGFAPPLGGFAAAAAFSLGVAGLSGGRRTGYDSLTALVLVGCLALGVVLASDVFHSGSSIDTLLFGSLLLIDGGDLMLAGGSAALVLAASLTLGQHWLVAGFDPDGAHALGARSRLADLALLSLVAVATTAALTVTGALLTTALFVVPAATTRLYVRRLPAWRRATVALLAVEGFAGVLLADQTNTPPGAAIAMISGVSFALAAALRMVPRRALTAAGAAALVAAAGCGGDGEAATGERLEVVATTTQIGDFARQVGGADVHVAQILQPNTDAHEYEPRPDDVKTTARAKVVFQSGDGLDKWMGDLVEESGASPKLVDLGKGVPVKLPGEPEGDAASQYDPHWWHDPRNAEAAVKRIRDTLAEAEPSMRTAFQRRAKVYLAKLKALDRGIARCFDAVPASKRRLVTDHDAFNYFTERYDIRVVGAVIPSQTTQAQPSAGDLAELSEVIRREKVRAVYPESSLNPKLATAIARQTGATARYTLYGDSTGPKGSRGATYLTMERANADAMARGFSGGSRGCSVAGIG